MNDTVAAQPLSSRLVAAPPLGARFRGNSGVSSDNNNNDIESPHSAISSPTNDRNGDIQSPTSRNNNDSPPKSSRKVVGLRSSLFSGAKEDNKHRRLSREDIRASPRLLGYIFQWLASSVMLISVLKFYFEDERKNEDTPTFWLLFQQEREGNSLRDELFLTLSGPVFTWKLIGCFVVSGIGTVINLVIILAHFDTLCLPSLWLRMFRDGSRYEQCIVISMAIFWAGGIHINTSPLAVGESQANIFFTTWICFFSSFINCGVWRVSAGRISIAEYVNNHHRETTYNWLWTFMFACTCAGAMSATYVNREYVSLKFRGQVINLSSREWVVSQATLWGLCFVCLIAIILNHSLKKSCQARLFCGGVVVLGWRQTEGLICLGLCGTLTRDSFWSTKDVNT